MKEDTTRFADIVEISQEPFIAQDLACMVLADKIAEGGFRKVFDFDIIPGTVVKYNPDKEANILEWNVWKSSNGTAWRKWLAPCLYMSPGGYFLIQKKVRPLKDTDKLPRSIPNAFEDIKRENWGFIGKSFVCHEYQFIDRALDIAMNVNRPLKFNRWTRKKY